MNSWLVGANVTRQWRRPFQGPILKAFGLGLKEVKRYVFSTWDDLHASNLAPLSGRFPFNPDSDVDATPEQVTKTVHPDKEFWQTFNSYIAPVCARRQGAWIKRPSRQYQIVLPRGMLKAVNGLEVLGKQLWDKKKKPQAIAVRVQALPLPARPAGSYNVVLAYFQAGEVTVFGFNQKPVWQDVLVKWWTNSTASVGTAFVRRNKSRKVFRNSAVLESNWSLFRLLRRSETRQPAEVANNIWRFKTVSPARDRRAVSVRFQTKGDPWQIFKALQ